MTRATINGSAIEYEMLGSGRPLILTPGGRFGMDVPGLRPLAELLAREWQVILWDRPNTGASDFKFTGDSESQMAADDLVGLLRHLDVGPAVVAGGSAGSRVSIIAAQRHPDVVQKLIVWMMSGGTFGTMFLAMNYLLPHIAEAWAAGMPAAAHVRDFGERIENHPRLAEQLLSLDPDVLIPQLTTWLEAYIPAPENPLPGVHRDAIAAIKAPTLIFRNGDGDIYHPVETSLAVHSLITGSELVEPPWPRDSWLRTKERVASGQGNLFDDWALLAPQILDWLHR